MEIRLGLASLQAPTPTFQTLMMALWTARHVPLLACSLLCLLPRSVAVDCPAGAMATGPDGCSACPAGTYRTGATHYNLARACGADGLQPCSTQQSSSMSGESGESAAVYAVDGNRNTAFGIGSCTHTEWGQGHLSPWWMVDLGQVRAVRAVKIWNRGDCCSERLQGFDIRVGDAAASYSSATACFTGGTAPMASPYTVQVDCEGSGRYLYIGLPGSSEALALCEVQVYEGCNTCPELSTSPAGSDAVSDCTCNAGAPGPDGGPCSQCTAGEYLCLQVL